MADACPVFDADSPLVRGLLGAVDCRVQNLIESAYALLFQSGGAFGPLITLGLTVYVALIGWRLLLGRGGLGLGDLTMSALKLGAVLTLTTQWAPYQRLVYHLLFFGPQQLADLIARPLWGQAFAGGDVLDGLQRAFTDLTAFSPATPPGGGGAPVATGGVAIAAGAGQLSTLLGRAGFESLLMLLSAVVLVLSTLGLLVASKIVLGLLLALGPLFIGFFLFGPTRGLFQGWLRAAAAFAFAPLAVTLVLGIGLTLLEPSLQQIETMRGSGVYAAGAGFSATIVVVAMAMVTLGLVGAGGLLASGLRLPEASVLAPIPAPERGPVAVIAPVAESRVTRIVRMASTTSRDASVAGATFAEIFAAGGSRRVEISPSPSAARGPVPLAERYGRQSRRAAGPRDARRSAAPATSEPNG